MQFFSPTLHVDPGKSNENSVMCIGKRKAFSVTIQVAEFVTPLAEVAATEDKVAQKLDEDEYLEVNHHPCDSRGLSCLRFLVLQTIELPLKDLRQQLDILQKEHGFIIDARLYCFAMGLEMRDLN